MSYGHAEDTTKFSDFVLDLLGLYHLRPVLTRAGHESEQIQEPPQRDRPLMVQIVQILLRVRLDLDVVVSLRKSVLADDRESRRDAPNLEADRPWIIPVAVGFDGVSAMGFADPVQEFLNFFCLTVQHLRQR
jgi:hypothetical protein